MLTDVWKLVGMHIHVYILHAFLIGFSCTNASIGGLQTLFRVDLEFK